MPASQNIPPRALALAIGLTILTGFVLSSSDAVGKELSARTNIWQAAWARYFFNALFVIAYLVLRKGWNLPRTRRPGLQLLRGSLLLATTLLMYAAIMLVPLANATTIQFLAPILVVVWAALFLRERTGPRHWIAVGGGFLGTVIVIGPNIGQFFAPEVLLPLGVACTLSVYLILTRILSAGEERAFTQIATTGVGALVLSLALPLFWVPPDLVDLTLMVAIGAVAGFGHTILVVAYSLAPASTLTPFLYSQVLSAALLTVFWFGETLSAMLILGAVVLVASGILLWWQERRASRRAAAWRQRVKERTSP